MQVEAYHGFAHLDHHGYAVLDSGLSNDQLEELHTCFMNAPTHTWTSRAPGHRHSCSHGDNGVHSNTAWGYIYNNPMADAFLEIVARHTESSVCIGVSGGDLCEPGALAQSLHSDFCSYEICCMKWGFSLSISVATRDISISDGPMRIVPWSNRAGHSYPDMLLEEPLMATPLCMKAGEMLIRDVRCPHGGSAHFGSAPRALPSTQVYSTGCCRGNCHIHKRINLITRDILKRSC